MNTLSANWSINKTICHYSQPYLGLCSHVYLFTKIIYIAGRKIFHCHPLKKFKDDGPWYATATVGIYTGSQAKGTL